MGFDLYQAQDWLASRGICEMEPSVAIDQMNNPNYINVLKPRAQPQQQWFPPGGGAQGGAPVMMPPGAQPGMMAPQGVNPMMNMMGQQMVGQLNQQMAAAGHTQQVQYQYQPQH